MGRFASDFGEDFMRACFLGIALAVFFGGYQLFGSEERLARELSCQPVNGYIQLPGILYDDLTPLARETFNANPAAVTNALYSLPFEEREDFITLYLEPESRERHRYFFARCREVADRRAMDTYVEGAEVIPPHLKAELTERERVRLALHEGAIPFRLGGRIVYIPIPAGYAVQEGPIVDLLEDTGISGSLAVFVKTVGRTDPEAGEPLVRRRVLATVRHVREGADNLATMLQAYRIMVDRDWRLASLYPPESPVEQAESVEYKWNLNPFAVRDNSFCYGQFEKTVDFHGVDQIRYRATAVVTLPGSYIQVSVAHLANTGLDTVAEMNTDIASWRDAILAVNGK